MSHRKHTLAFVLVAALSLFAFAGCTSQDAPLPEPDTQKSQSLPLPEEARIGVMRGSTNELFAKQAYPKATLIPYENYLESAKAMQHGDIDYAMMDHATALHVTQVEDGLKLLPEALTNETTAMAMNPKNTDLNAKISARLDQYLADGTMAEIIAHWIKEDGSAYSPGQITPLENVPVLRVAVTTATEPRCFLDAEGKPSGMLVELLDRLAYDLGMVAVYTDAPFGSHLELLASDAVDLVPAMYETEERAKQVAFTTPYFENPQVFVVKDTPSSTP